MDKEELRRILAAHPKTRIKNPALALAAVLIPIYCSGDDCSVIVGKRSEQVKYHKGQICLPGGGRDMTDRDLLTTALRESREEIGLDPANIEIVGELDDQITVSGYIVSPFVGYLHHPQAFTADGRELEAVFPIPLAVLRDARNWREEDEVADGRTTRAYSVQHGGHVVWGTTARILRQLVEVLGGQGGTSR